MGTVTLKDLAAKLGLFITTISQALAGYGNAAQTTRHWARAAREMGYAPTLLPCQSHKGPADTLIFVPLPLPPVSSDPLLSRLLAGIGRKLMPLKRRVIVRESASFPVRLGRVRLVKPEERR